MNHFAGKKVLCFLALPHHNRFLVPIMEALQSHGMEVVYFTVPAEGAFEITLNQANLPYRHILDYADAVAVKKSEVGYREIRDTYQQKILGNPVLQSVPVVIQDKVIRSAVENYNAIERMIEREKPDLLFALHEINPWGKMLGYLSHVHQVPFFTLQEGLYYADLYYYRFHTDFSTACLVWGEDCRQILLRAGCSDDKIFPVGNTHIWAARKEFTEPVRIQRTRESLGIEPGKKIILLLMSHSEYSAFDARTFLDWMKHRGDVVAVFKWHPVTSKAIVERAMKNVQDQPNVYSVFGIDTYALIGASDICITVGNSTTGLEALAFDKPLLESRMPDQQYSFCAQGVAEAVAGFETFGPKCEAIFSSGISEEWRSRVDRYLAYNFARRDEQTMDLIMLLVHESLATRVQAKIAPAQLSCAVVIDSPCSIILPVDDSGPEMLLSTLAAVSENIPSELFEIIVVNCSSSAVVKEILQSLGGDVKVIEGKLGWSYGTACNHAARQACGKYLAFLKPGLAPEQGWLEGLLEIAEQEDGVGIVSGMTLNKNSLIDHMGVAFDVNQSPFSIYQLMSPDFFAATKQREFRAVKFPFLILGETFVRLGGFATEFFNRFEDIDLCLRMEQAKRRVVYTPKSSIRCEIPSWQTNPEQDLFNRIRFFAKWTGALWQDDEVYLAQDSLSHDVLSALYRDLKCRLAAGVERALENSVPGSVVFADLNSDETRAEP